MPNVQEALERAWSDESFKENLLRNPKQVLSEYGVNFANSVQVQAHENTPGLVNYVLPEPSDIPQGADIEHSDPIAGKVIKTAFSDPAFKAKLLQDPKSAIADETGTELPDSLQIHVYENTPILKHIVLPVNPATEELSDAELEAVAGGGNKGAAIGCAAGGVAAGAGCAAANATDFTVITAAIGAGATFAAGGAAGISAAASQ